MENINPLIALYPLAFSDIGASIGAVQLGLRT